ncbi:hypothetical protein HPG69_003624 [Diceros bicornis minor]|uniref:PDZ domain-containing protein n=1 Tax=Diceros bicornis minor TaxID=77932 RepID=A0A7J7ET84_DICBM|nr:hypothetical protein HPG69_003624 [Diceros bicornis minor]
MMLTNWKIAHFPELLFIVDWEHHPRLQVLQTRVIHRPEMTKLPGLPTSFPPFSKNLILELSATTRGPSDARQAGDAGQASSGFHTQMSPVCAASWAGGEEAEHCSFGAGSLSRRRKALALREDGPRRRAHLHIGMPHDFRPVSSIIDVDILPETHRRVRLYRHGCQKPLGFYIRDGMSVRVAPQGLEKVPGIFISRMVPGGLAESTGLLAVDDEVLEVNGIEVAGKTLDQVTDMMIANSHNLIVTVKPANQRNNVVRGSRASGSSGRSSDSVASRHSLPTAHILQNLHPDEMESDEEADVVLEGVLEPRLVPRPPPGSLARVNGAGLAPRLHSPGREGGGSVHRLLSSLRSDPRHSLALPPGGVEEHGPAVTFQIHVFNLTHAETPCGVSTTFSLCFLPTVLILQMGWNAVRNHISNSQMGAEPQRWEESTRLRWNGRQGQRACLQPRRESDVGSSRPCGIGRERSALLVEEKT